MLKQVQEMRAIVEGKEDARQLIIQRRRAAEAARKEEKLAADAASKAAKQEEKRDALMTFTVSQIDRQHEAGRCSTSERQQMEEIIEEYRSREIHVDNFVQQVNPMELDEGFSFPNRKKTPKKGIQTPPPKQKPAPYRQPQPDVPVSLVDISSEDSQQKHQDLQRLQQIHQQKLALEKRRLEKPVAYAKKCESL